MPKKIKMPTTNLGHEIIEVRKVKWDMLWHLCYINNSSELSWNRVDKKTALKVATQIEKAREH